MAQFNVTYSNGEERIENESSAETVEQFINIRFGSCDTSKVKVTLVGEESPAPKKTPKK
jgi:hypothetical protein